MSDMLIRALSVHQPWAHAIMHLGKNVENRTWGTEWRGWLVIHASKAIKSYDREARLDWKGLYGVELPEADKMTFGAILGAVKLVDVAKWVPASRWSEYGSVKWILEDPRPLEKPIPFRGRQGLFALPEDVEKTIARKLKLK